MDAFNTDKLLMDTLYPDTFLANTSSNDEFNADKLVMETLYPDRFVTYALIMDTFVEDELIIDTFEKLLNADTLIPL